MGILGKNHSLEREFLENRQEYKKDISIKNTNKMQFKYNLKKAIELQLSYQKGMILQGYEGADLNECITQAILKSDKVFLRYFLDLCNTGTDEELEEFLNTTTEKNLVKECTMIFMRYVDPEGFLKALMLLRTKEMLEKKKVSI